MGSYDFEDNLAFGNLGEELVARWLRAKGCATVALYACGKVSGIGAPLLLLREQGITLPDLDVYHEGQRRLGEVKLYHGPAENQTKFGTPTSVHGIRKKHFEHYERVAQITGTKVVVYIAEFESGVLLRAYLEELRKVCFDCQCSRCAGGGSCGAPLVYWRRDAMEPVHRFPDAELIEIRARAAQRKRAATDEAEHLEAAAHG